MSVDHYKIEGILKRIEEQVNLGRSITLARKNAGLASTDSAICRAVMKHPRYCELLNIYLEKGQFHSRYYNDAGILKRVPKK